MKSKIENLLGLAYIAKETVIGSDDTINLIKENKISLVILDKNTNTDIEKQLIKLCDSHGIELIRTLTSEEISKSIGLKNVKVIGIKSEGFKNLIVNA